FVLEEIILGRVEVDGSGKCRLETRQMRPALDRVDVIGVGENYFADRVGPLQRHLDVNSVAHAFEENRIVQWLVALGEGSDVLGNSTFVMELLGLADALVCEPYLQTRIQIRHLAQV